MPLTINNSGATSKIWGQNARMPPLISSPVLDCRTLFDWLCLLRLAEGSAAPWHTILYNNYPFDKIGTCDFGVEIQRNSKTVRHEAKLTQVEPNSFDLENHLSKMVHDANSSTYVMRSKPYRGAKSNFLPATYYLMSWANCPLLIATKTAGRFQKRNI